GTESTSSSLIVAGDAPLAYVKRSNAMSINPTDGTPSAPGGDLMVRESSSASAKEHNLTAQFTQGKGDASDPEVSYDGKRIVFAMKCPTSNTSTFKNASNADVPACTGRWNIWEYDMTGAALTAGKFSRITSSTDHDDVDPAYLPGSQGFVFSSNRQTKSSPNQALGRQYFALDEYERERVLNLHTMDAAGANIQQISFNQSHDRNPVVRPNGDIMFARWEHVADRNRFAIFRVKPDGTDMFVLYGAQSPGNSFLHPRDMDPSGPYKGFVSSSLMPLSRTQEGGALMIIDAANYPEHNTPANTTVPASGGQVQGTQQALSTGMGLSLLGRLTTPYPLWDGTDRVLVAWQPCQVTRNGAVVSCTSLTAEERALLNDRNRLAADQANDAVQDNAPATYAIYMFDSVKQTWLIVAAPPVGFMYTDPVAIASRAEPATIAPTAVDAALAAQGLATIEVRSIYDTDGLNRMAEQMLVTADRANCPTGAPGIAVKAPTDPMDTRPMVADLARIKNPADAAYRCTPVRFVRATRAVAPPSSTMGLRSAIGDTEFEMQQILGYAQVEPDGSFKLEVPADVPLALAIIDSKGRAFQTHTNWIQVRPGERRTCDGCHSPRRGAALNDVAMANTLPAGLKASMVAQHAPGETMAALRMRLEKMVDPLAMRLKPDMVFTDVWADTNVAGVAARPSISLRYTGNPNPADDLATLAPVNGVVNYPDHIQPLWTRDRGPNTCTSSSCHDGLDRTDGLRLVDLRRGIGGSGRLTSYQRLVEGDPDVDANGNPRVRIEDGVPVIQRRGALVNSSSGAANTAGIARKSRLTEVMFGENLFAPGSVRDYYRDPGSPHPRHATLLNAAEKRLLAEWMDLGGQYYNDPFTTGTSVRSVTALSQTTFETQVFPILRSTCAAGCHQAIGTDPTIPTGQTFAENRFVLTGSPEGDYNVTLSMISDTCAAASNSLLSRPSTMPHPAGATTQTAAVLPAGSAGYNAIATWIASGCVP
ncbi:MAG: hypothetical protein ABL900_04450, partial [Burkholderiaceae bacterium]